MEGQQGMRLNKYLSDAGVCSRREADILIERGSVLVDGTLAELGMRVTAEQSVMVNGKLVIPEEEEIFLAVNKPEGIVCTTTSRFQKNEKNIVDFIGYPKRVYPIGRLDKDSEGLILMTNKGELVNEILKGSHMHEKEYIVTVNKPVTDTFLQQMRGGVPILDTVTRECEVERVRETVFRIVLTQGLNRQIRRMCEYCGYRVVKLKRVRVMNIQLNDLEVGGYRSLTEQELIRMKALLKQSTQRRNGQEGNTDGGHHSGRKNQSDDKRRSEKEGRRTQRADRISQ